MRHGPAISVIVRTLGRAARLEECLASLAAQTDCELEVVVVDMSAGAASGVIARERGLCLVHLDTGGRVLNRPVALNAGIRRASGRYIGVLDDDNCWEPAQAARLCGMLDASGADLAYTGVTRRFLTPDGAPLSEDRFHAPFDYVRLLFGNYIYASTVAFRKAAWEQAGRYDARFTVYEDWEFYIRLARGGKVVTTPESGSVSRSFTGQPGVAEHTRETLDCSRCHVALRWKHRRLYTRELFREHAAMVARDYAHMDYLGVRQEDLPLLAGWWWHNHPGQRWKHRAWNR